MVRDAKRRREVRRQRPAVEPLEGRALMSALAAASPVVSVRYQPSGGAVIYKDRVSDPVLRAKFQELADAFGWTIRVKTGDRDPDKNDAVNGSKNSHHLSKRAGDFHVDGLSDADAFQILRAWDGLATGYQVIEHGDYTNTGRKSKPTKQRPIQPGNAHLHMGHFPGDKPSEFKTEGLTPQTSGHYELVGPIESPPTPPAPAPAIAVAEPTPPPVPIPGKISLSQTAFSLDASGGGPLLPPVAFTITNTGPPGSEVDLEFTSFGGSLRPSAKTLKLAAGQSTAASLSADITGLPAGPLLFPFGVRNTLDGKLTLGTGSFTIGPKTATPPPTSTTPTPAPVNKPSTDGGGLTFDENAPGKGH